MLASFDPVYSAYRCDGCEKSCMLSLVDFGDGRVFVSGNRCSEGARIVKDAISAIGEDEYLGRIEDDHAESLGLELREMLQDAGIADDATVFCVLSYDSSEDGSRDAYHAVIRKLKEIQLGNNQFSCTQVDRAVPDDEE